MKKIILDTNALMAIGEFNLDIFTAVKEVMDVKYKIYVLDGTLDELHKIMVEQRGKFKRFAKLALSIIDAKKIEVIVSDDACCSVDDVLVDMSKKGDLVLTQDVELKKKLVRPYLTIRQKKKVILVN